MKYILLATSIIGIIAFIVFVHESVLYASDDIIYSGSRFKKKYYFISLALWVVSVAVIFTSHLLNLY